MIEIRCHPFHPGILCCSDGSVFVRRKKRGVAWTRGFKHTKDGHMAVGYNGGLHYVHRLIAEAFLPNPEDKAEVDHINRNPSDNRVENLRWATHLENMRNRADVDRLTTEGRPHRWEDCRCGKNMLFSDGKTHRVSKRVYRILKPLKPCNRVWRAVI